MLQVVYDEAMECFSNFSAYQRDVECWLKSRFLDPTLRESDSAGLKWAYECAFLAISWVMLITARLLTTL